MDSNKIKGFILAVREKSLSKASQAFSYTPSAFSHMMDNFENEIGLKLINRTHKGIELTENGKALFDNICDVNNAVERLLNVAKKIKNEENDTLRIGTYSSISENLLPQILKKYKEYNKNIKISITVMDSFLNWRETDCQDLILADLEKNDSCGYLELMREPFMAVVPSDTFKSRKLVKREELYKFSYIAPKDSHLNGYFDSSKFKEIITVNSADNTTALSMVKANIGVTVLPSLAVKSHMQGVKVLPMVPTVFRTLGFVFEKNAKPCVYDFLSFIKENMKKITVR